MLWCKTAQKLLSFWAIFVGAYAPWKVVSALFQSTTFQKAST